MATVERTSRDVDEPVTLASGDRHTVKLRFLRVGLLESGDVHFNLDSALLLPHLDRAAAQRDVVSGLAVVVACLLHAKQNPSQKILVAGHTDRSGTDEYNLGLSRLRAENVLALLRGDRERWVATAREKLKVLDIQLLMSWLTRSWGWQCDPGVLDGVNGPRTTAAIRMFQEAYNEHVGGDLTVDGIVGKQSLGAMFDLYMKEIALLAGFEESELASTQSGLGFVEPGKEFVGCGEHHPIDPSTESSDRSASDRRVEILFFEPGDPLELDCHPSREACLPDACQLYDRRRYGFDPLPLAEVPRIGWLDLQTVDAFGYRVPNFDLELTLDSGETLPVTTDDAGYWSDRVRANERIEVRTASGEPVRFGASDYSDDSSETATIVVRAAARNVTDLIVPTPELDEDTVRERQALVERHGRSPAGRPMRSRRSGGVGGHVGEEATEISPRGGEERAFSGRSWGRVIADNLCIAAGWSDDPADVFRRLHEHIGTWLEDRFPTAARRGYYLNLLYGDQLILYEGQRRVAQYDFVEGQSVRGAYGIYTTFEFFGVEGNTIFTSMATQSHYIGPHREEASDGTGDTGSAGPDATGEPEEDAEGAADAGGGMVATPIHELVAESQREDYLRRVSSFDARRMLSLVYFLPAPGTLVLVARHGGTGLLEDYPADGRIRDRVHERNLAVIRNMGRAHRAYIDGYVRRVESIPSRAERGQPHPEVLLHRLGPPESAFTIHRPVGANDDEYWSLLEAAGPTSGLDAWRAISAKLDEIWQERPEGSMWMVFEFSATPGAIAGPYSEASIKLNFEVRDDFRVVPTASREAPLSVGTPAAADLPANVRYQVKTDDATGRDVSQVKFSLGKYGVEAANDGNVKFSSGLVFSEFNQTTAQGGFGMEVSLHNLLERHFRRKGQDPPPWIGDLPNIAMKVGMYFQLISQGTILRIVSNAPGFFQMRPRTEFMSLDWNSLHFDERTSLETLGWDAESWDTGAKPPSAAGDFEDLTADEMQAAIRIPVPTRDPYWAQFWHAFSQRRNIQLEPAVAAEGRSVDSPPSAESGAP